MRVIALMMTILFGLVTPALAQQVLLEFPATGDAKAHDEFIQGVIALHSSAYDDAAAHFRAAENIDPRFVMAYWGEAMSFNHPFWNQQDLAGARRALAKLGPTRAARSAKAATARERAYLDAVENLYGEGDRDYRDFAFADAMRKLAFDYPNDYEASAFYVLALLSTRRVGDPAYPQKQSTAIAILRMILQKYPDHPGALHYAMHTYDDPEHAPLALELARRYERAAVGDANFHAMHMPSHIYVQVGAWRDVARANQTAFDASDRWVNAHGLHIARRDYHSLEYLQYAWMQMGQYEKASTAMSTMLESARQIQLPGMIDETAVMAARFAIETGHLDVLTQITSAGQAEVVFARGLAALDGGHIDIANAAASALQTMNKADVETRRLVHAATDNLLETILLSRIALAENRPADAQRLGLAAVNIERRMDVASELNGIVKPAAEFYGETLLRLKKPGEAADQFADALRQHPQRALSLLGLARARKMSGDTENARKTYADLASIWSEADMSLPAVNEMRDFLKR